jgi:hypothetical protein
VKATTAKSIPSPNQPLITPLPEAGEPLTSMPLSLLSERERMIAEAAYYRYERRRGEPGDPLHDWLEAEAEFERRPAP